MSDLELMYRKGVPLPVIFHEARVQQRAGVLELGAKDFLLSVGWSP